jgi:hypothetical protein
MPFLNRATGGRPISRRREEIDVVHLDEAAGRKCRKGLLKEALRVWYAGNEGTAVDKIELLRVYPIIIEVFDFEAAVDRDTEMGSCECCE